MMKKGVMVLIGIAVLDALFLYFVYDKKEYILNPLGKETKVVDRTLDKYAYVALKDKSFPGSDIKLGDIVKEGDFADSRMFYFTSDAKTVSGLANIPKTAGKYPVIVMIRGYADLENYTSGTGTLRTGEMFAQQGFITLAPDFLGYGESDPPSKRSLEERFQTQTTALDLMASIKNLNETLIATNSGAVTADLKHIGIWGHSNGGQIALSILEITGKEYPTVLWNPVSKPFPYSILFFTDDFEDHGKGLRRVVAEFEKDYDVEKYSLTNYLDWITAPIQLHQAADDEAVPKRWSDQLVEELKHLDKDVAYFVYPGENHNFNLGSWPLAVERSAAFYRSRFLQ